MKLRAPLILLLSAAAVPAHATSLEEAIAAGLTHAPEVAMADAQADAAGAKLEQARSGSLPTVSVSGTIGVGRLDPRNFFGLGAANVTPRAAQASVEQPLFAGGRVQAGIDQARAGISAAQAGKTSARSQISMAVTQAYGDVLTADRLGILYGQMVTQMQEVLRQAQLRFKDGESPSTDVAQAKARLAEAQAGLARAEGIKVSAAAHFANLTGLDATGLDPLPANPALPATLEEAMEQARAHNPMLLQAEAGLRAAQAAARGARGERLPTVGAFAEAASIRDQFFPGYIADSATVGIRAKWDLFTGGRVSGKIAESDAGVRAAQAQRQSAEQAMQEQVISAFQNVRTAQLVERAAADRADAAAQALESVRHEVRVGMKPQLDLLDAEREAIAASADAVRAQTDRAVAAYQLLAVTGA